MATVQHVTRKSSDELLRKFAEAEEEEADTKKEIVRLAKRRKRNNSKTSRAGNEAPVSEYYTSCVVEKRSLLPPVTGKSLIMRQLGLGRGSSQFKARHINNRSILVALEKTWRKTVERASRALVDKHYNRHKRLISDVV